MQGTATVAGTEARSAGGLLSGNIGRRPVALFGKDALDGGTDGLGGDAQFARARSDQFLGRIDRCLAVRGDRIARIG